MTIPVRAHGAAREALTVSVARARALARVLDDAVRIPGTRIAFGLDPLLGLVPGIGDLVGAAMSGYIVFVAARGGVPPAILLRMLATIALDTVLGSVPLFGDAFDVAWKSNRMNIELLDRYLADPRGTHVMSRGLVAALFLLIALLIGAAIALAVVLVTWLLSLTQH